ncbi:MAG: heme-binding protein [Alphaproteobacteria bacterium]|nr:heme-binding protein [Alphaproteobacteria bacterium]
MSDFRISLDKANTIISAAFAKGKDAGMKPLSCVVVDAGGHVIAFQRQDGTSFLRLDIARGKAAGALALGVNSRRIEEMAKDRPHFISALAHLTPGGLAPVAGGVIVKGPDGLPIGAVGVTGDTSDNDEVAALAGIAAAGLTPL